MRHKVVKHSFGRKTGPRKALIRGLVEALVENGRIKTTVVKAKELRRHVERAVTSGKPGTVHARRILLAKYPNKNTVAKLVDDISVRFKDRPGGYTRIIKLGPRPGDMADMAYIEFVDYEIPENRAELIEDMESKKAEVHAKKHKAHRKSVRKMQNESRRINRA
ncbi:MAG: 50S ribosomal protein L17 [Bdellovibrionaceae bacterium]|jgi:large subunit ribosomal protein L17|nr:50S ribosomal protein L17 [Pseudobdellovibrionaceae bacterium]